MHRMRWLVPLAVAAALVLFWWSKRVDGDAAPRAATEASEHAPAR